jgi:TIR domain
VRNSVFVSYTRNDRVAAGIAQSIAASAKKYMSSYDYQKNGQPDIQGDGAIKQYLYKEMDNWPSIILVLSQNYFHSPFCVLEYTTALTSRHVSKVTAVAPRGVLPRGEGPKMRSLNIRVVSISTGEDVSDLISSI